MTKNSLPRQKLALLKNKAMELRRPHDWVLYGPAAHTLWVGGSNDGKTSAREEVLIRLKSGLGTTHGREFKKVIALHSTLGDPIKRDWHVLAGIKKELMPEIVTGFPATEQGLRDAQGLEVRLPVPRWPGDTLPHARP